MPMSILAANMGRQKCSLGASERILLSYAIRYNIALEATVEEPLGELERTFSFSEVH